MATWDTTRGFVALTALSGEVAYVRVVETGYIWQGIVCDLLLWCSALSWWHMWVWWTRTHMNMVSAWPVSSYWALLWSTVLIDIDKCCGHDKLTWTVSCISHNISHPPCCKLAQVVALSSPPFTVKLLVWLPSSCNAAPLIAAATTQLKEVAFSQPITQYHILCCYRVSRPGLLNGQWQKESGHSVEYWKFIPILFCFSYRR